MRYKRNGIINNMINKKKTLLIILSIILILPISFIIANMSEDALSYSVRRGDILIGAFVVLICILIRFGIDRILVRLIEEELEKETKEKTEVEAVDTATENADVVVTDSGEENYSDAELAEDIDDYEEGTEGSIIGSLFKNIIIYVIAATLLIIILFLYSIQWISLVLAITAITFISIVLLEKNIYRRRSSVNELLESEEPYDDLDEDIKEDVNEDLNRNANEGSFGTSVEKKESDKLSTDEKLEKQPDEKEEPGKSEEKEESEKTEKKDKPEQSEEKERAEQSEEKAEPDNNKNTERKGKKKRRKRDRTAADRIKSIKEAEKIIQVNDDIELSYAEPKKTSTSEEEKEVKPGPEEKEEKKPEPEEKQEIEERPKPEKQEETEEKPKSEKLEEKKVESEKKKQAEEITETKKKEEKEPEFEKIEDKTETEPVPVQEESDDTEKNETVEESIDEDTEVIQKKEIHVGNVMFSSILQTMAYLLPIILVLLVYGDLQAKHFTGPYYMLVIVLSILTAGIEVAARNISDNKVAYIITSIFLTLFLCHRSILIGLVFLLAAYLILVIVPIVYDNWGTGGTKAVNRAKISMSRLVSRLFTVIIILLAIWKLSYGAIWELDYLVILSVAVSSIGYMAERHS